MKNLLFFLLLLPVITQAQFYVDLGGGIHHSPLTTHHSPVIMPIIKISVGYQVSNIIAEAVMQPTLSRVVNSPNYFGGKIGYNIAGSGLIPSAGYYFNLCNADNPENNGWYPGYSLKYQHAINDNGGLYAEAMYINHSVSITAGFMISFN